MISTCDVSNRQATTSPQVTREGILRSLKLGLTIVLPLLTAFAPPQQTHAALSTIADSVAVFRGVGEYIAGRYGNNLILGRVVNCASMAECKQEGASTEVALGGRKRRDTLFAALLSTVGHVATGQRAASLNCDATTCNVRGADRFIRVKEPIFAGDTATVRIRVDSNEGRFFRSQIDIVQFVRQASGGWRLTTRIAHGLGAR